MNTDKLNDIGSNLQVQVEDIRSSKIERYKSKILFLLIQLGVYLTSFPLAYNIVRLKKEGTTYPYEYRAGVRANWAVFLGIHGANGLISAAKLRKSPKNLIGALLIVLVVFLISLVTFDSIISAVAEPHFSANVEYGVYSNDDSTRHDQYGVCHYKKQS